MPMGRHRAGTVRALQGERTRERLVEAACDLFVRDGFAATSLDAIVERAGVTKGALYHHVADKRALYLAAYDAAHVRLAERIRELSVDGRGRPPFEVFVDACAAFLESVVTEPWVVRLTVAEGPVALGNAEWRTLDEGYAWDTIGVPLQQLQSRGFVRADVDVVVATALINAAINEAALRVATAPDVSAELSRAVPALRALLAGFGPMR
jgi:AcrR family transcriptional regulator